MEPVQREFFSNAISKLLTHPITKEFQTPMANSIYADKDYLKIIKNPIDLITIQKQLKSDNYTVTNLLNDLKQIEANAVTYFGNDSEMSKAAKELLRIFNKLTSRPNINQWCVDVHRIHGEMALLVRTNVALVKNDRFIFEDEYLAMSKAVEQLTDEEDQNEIKGFIFLREPHVFSQKKNLRFSFAELKTQTLKDLIDFLKIKYQKKNLIYPEVKKTTQ